MRYVLSWILEHIVNPPKIDSEFIKQLNVFPTPWGLKIIAECRGITPASFSQPLSARRLKQSQTLTKWFHQWPYFNELIG